MNWVQRQVEALRLGFKRWRRRNAFFFSLSGAPGSGKGTQAELLSAEGFPMLGVGDALREQVRLKTAIGLEAERYMLEGKLVPTPLAMAVIGAALSAPRFDGGGGLDGAPRHINSVGLLDAQLAQWGCALDLLILLDASDEVIEERCAFRRLCSNRQCKRYRLAYHLHFDPPAAVCDGSWSGLEEDLSCDLCGSPLVRRADDKVETIRERLAVFHQESGPIIEVFAKRGCLCVINVNNEMTPQDVCKEVLAAVKNARAARRPGKGLKFFLGR